MGVQMCMWDMTMADESMHWGVCKVCVYMDIVFSVLRRNTQENNAIHAVNSQLTIPRSLNLSIYIRSSIVF